MTFRAQKKSSRMLHSIQVDNFINVQSLWTNSTITELNLSSAIVLWNEFLINFNKEFALSIPLDVTDISSVGCKI